MLPIEILLYIKILVTIVACVIPMLLLPGTRVQRLYGIDDRAVPLVRLYGVAITALLVGYASGVVDVWAGEFPTGVVWMGIVSNVGASLTMVMTDAWRKAPPLAAIFGAIGVGLIAAVVSPEDWMSPLATIAQAVR